MFRVMPEMADEVWEIYYEGNGTELVPALQAFVKKYKLVESSFPDSPSPAGVVETSAGTFALANVLGYKQHANGMVRVVASTGHPVADLEGEDAKRFVEIFNRWKIS